MIGTLSIQQVVAHASESGMSSADKATVAAAAFTAMTAAVALWSVLATARAAKRAQMIARLDRVQRPDKMNDGLRLVIENAGPAFASSVHVVARMQAPNTSLLAANGLLSEDSRTLTVQLGDLSPRATIGYEVARSMASKPGKLEVTITWKDDRWGAKTKKCELLIH